MVAQCAYTCNVFYPLYISHDRLPIPKLQNKNHDGQHALRHYWGSFFTYYKIMRAQSHAVLLIGLFFFFLHSIQGVQWEETTACMESSLHNATWNPKLTFNIQFINSKKVANLTITIIIPTIPQEWKYNTSNNISSTRTARDTWLYWNLKNKIHKWTVNKNVMSC